MALNVGPDFKQRWLDVPEAVRQAFIDDLNRICEVLSPETVLEHWQQQDQLAQQQSLQKIDAAYAARKAELLEAARRRKQQALEHALAQKRAEELAYNEQLKCDEERRFAEQTQTLNQLNSHLAIETRTHIQRYTQNPALTILSLQPEQRSAIDNLKLRLELEAESHIETQLQNLRQQLKQAAQEEIDFLIAQQNEISSDAL